jgi:hypothetical protein
MKCGTRPVVTEAPCVEKKEGEGVNGFESDHQKLIDRTTGMSPLGLVSFRVP